MLESIHAVRFITYLGFSHFFSICKKFDEISDRCQEISDKTSELVALEEYVKHASSVRVKQLQAEVDQSAERLLFLLDYATLPCKFKRMFQSSMCTIKTNNRCCCFQSSYECSLKS